MTYKITTLETKKTPLAIVMAVAVAAMGAANKGYADGQEAEEKEKSRVESVVVVGRTTNTEITPVDIEKQQANDLADVFRHIPSVSVGGSLGIAQKVYIRGMEDTLLNITVDGAPQTGTLFHHTGRVSIEPELLKSVEVQAGAGEATSGSGAIGGAIRFQTKSADDLLDAGQAFGGFVKANYFSNDGTKGSAALYGKVNDSVGVLASYLSIDRNNMEDGNGDEILATAADQNLAFLKVDGRISENQEIVVSYERREESGELGRRPNWVVLEGDLLYPMEGERNTFVAGYRAQISDMLNLNATVYVTDSDLVQDGPFGLYGGNTESSGFDIRNTSKVGEHTLTYGAELRNDEVKSGPRGASVQDYIDAGWETSISEEGEVLGVYIQDHWQVSDFLLVSMGLRYDSYDLEQVNYNNEVSDSGISPNIGFSYSVTDEINIVVGHARAMRGKEIGDSFTLESAGIDPDLEAEEVDNTELGLEYNGDIYAVSATVYQSNIDNVIYDQIGAGTNFENIGELESNGFELFGEADFGRLYMSASVSLSDSELNGNTVEGYEHNGLGNSRGDTYALEVNYDFSSALQVGWNFTFVDSLKDIEVLHRAVELGWIAETQTVDKPGYVVHDIYLRWLPTDSLTVNFGVQNLTNKQYRDHSSVADYNHIPGWGGVAGVAEAGRDIRLSASFSF